MIEASPAQAHAAVAAESHTAGTALVTMMGTWLAEHSYQSADLAISVNDAASAGDSNSRWTVFAGMDVSRLKIDSGADVNVEGGKVVLGVTRKAELDSGSLLIGAFVEAGSFKYDVGTLTLQGVSAAGGSGKTRSAGAGLMFRREWTGGLQAEASLRAGVLTNEFKFTDLPDTQAYRGSYTATSRYVGGHLGLVYGIRITPSSLLQLTSRGYWTHISGNSVLIGKDHTLNLGAMDELTFRGGARYTFSLSPQTDLYLGGYYESLFYRRRVGTSSVPDLSRFRPGNTGIFEFGAILRPRNTWPGLRFSFGVQYYVGRYRGVSGGFSLEYGF
jgi:hypothetical protein